MIAILGLQGRAASSWGALGKYSGQIPSDLQNSLLRSIGSNCLWIFSIEVGGETREEESNSREEETEKIEVGERRSADDVQEEEEVDDDEGTLWNSSLSSSKTAAKRSISSLTEVSQEEILAGEELSSSSSNTIEDRSIGGSAAILSRGAVSVNDIWNITHSNFHTFSAKVDIFRARWVGSMCKTGVGQVAEVIP